MRKVIYGKLYDTDTANLIGEWDVSCAADEFCFCRGKLYQKKTGEFFLFGSTAFRDEEWLDYYHNYCNGNWYIEPLDTSEAQRIVACHFNAGVYEEIFGGVME